MTNLESKNRDGVMFVCLIILRDLRKNRLARGALSIVDILTLPQTQTIVRNEKIHIGLICSLVDSLRWTFTLGCGLLKDVF